MGGYPITTVRLVGTPMPAMINRDDLVRASKRENLEVPDVAVRGPRMEEYDRRPSAISVVENFDSAIVSVRHQCDLVNWLFLRGGSVLPGEQEPGRPQRAPHLP